MGLIKNTNLTQKNSPGISYTDKIKNNFYTDHE